MKTVTGKIVSSTPVSISKAASILSKFVSADTGASQAVTAYLRRANTAFDELVRLHSQIDRKKLKKHKSDASSVSNVAADTEGKGKFKNSKEGDDKMVNLVKEDKREGERKKKIKKVDGEIGNFGDGGGSKMGIGKMKEEERSSLGEEIGRKEDKKKKEKREKHNVGCFDENGGETKNNMKIKEEAKNTEQDGGKMVYEEEKKKKKKKKRKGREGDEESIDAKKKRRKEDN